MVISVPLAEGSQGWVPLILRDDYFICQNTHRDCLSFPVFKSRSPSQYVITSPVTYNHSLLLTLWLQRHGMKVPRACFWFSSHISEFLLYESTCHVLCLSYCLIPSTPDLGEKYGKLMSVKCGAGVSLAWVMSTRHASCVGCWVSCLQECLLLRIFRHQCAYEFPFPLLSVLTVIRRNWTKRLTHVNWSSCGCWESVELREKEKRRKKKEMNRIKVADESQLEEKKL